MAHTYKYRTPAASLLNYDGNIDKCTQKGLLQIADMLRIERYQDIINLQKEV